MINKHSDPSKYVHGIKCEIFESQEYDILTRVIYSLPG